MTPSSGFLSSTSLPFGADAHTDATLRRSVSVPRSVHHEYQAAGYGQTHLALIADARAVDAASSLPSIQMPPSSTINTSKSHKKVVRPHRKLFWLLIGILSISLVASTVAIVLGVVKGHQPGHCETKCAAIVVGVIGFLGMVGSAAVIWLVLTRRKERARLEKRWADEEKPKEERSFRELQTGNHLHESIRTRNRSLSRSCSRGRGRGRDRAPKPVGGELPSFRAMTTTPTSSTRMPDHNARPVSRRARSPWPGPMDVSNDINDNLDDENNDAIGRNYDDNEDDTENCRGHDKGDQARDTSNRRVSASTQFHDPDSWDSENEDSNKAETASQPDTAILEQEILSEVGRTSPILLNTNPTYIDSSPMKPHPAASGPYDSPRLPPIGHTPFDTDTVRSSDVGIDNTRGYDDTPPGILSWQNRERDSAQSDENFQAMLDLADDVGSDDEKDRQLRRDKGKEGAKKWESTVDSEAGAGERGERGKKLREAVERGLQRVADRKKQRREGVVGARTKLQGEG